MPAHLEGDSFAPLIAQPDLPWKKAVFGQCLRDGRMGHAIRTSTHRFVVWSKPGESESSELYDLANDPDENLNVADEPAFREAWGHCEDAEARAAGESYFVLVAARSGGYRALQDFVRQGLNLNGVITGPPVMLG